MQNDGKRIDGAVACHGRLILHFFQAGPDQPGELLLRGGGGFQDLLLAQRLIQNTGGHVGQQGQTQHFHAAVTGHDDLGCGGHAHGIAAQNPGGPDLGGGFVLGAVAVEVDTLPQVDALFLCGLAGQFLQQELRDTVRSVNIERY